MDHLSTLNQRQEELKQELDATWVSLKALNEALHSSFYNIKGKYKAQEEKKEELERELKKIEIQQAVGEQEPIF